MRSLALRSMLTGLVLVAVTLVYVGDASAQCATCPAPTVAYSPVVAQAAVAVQPTVAYRPYTGWYPGKLLDRLRLRRAGVSAPAPAYTAAYAPTYAAAYPPAYTAPPTYTAAYAPASTAAFAPTYTAAYRYPVAYRPYVTSFAPLTTTVAAPCNSCVQTVARPVLMRPVVATPVCDTCSYTPSCGCNACSTGCDACSSGVSQAVYSEAPACSSCNSGDVVPSPPSIGRPTPQPSLTPVPAPQPSQYQRSQRPITGSGSRESEPPPVSEDPLNEFDPGPADEAGSSTYFNPPRLLGPRDRTAARTYKSRKPTVDVWTAVYRGPETSSASQTSARSRTQAEIDADGWEAVPSNR